MDLIAVSFVQSAADVEFVRKTLDAAGGTGERRASRGAALPTLVNGGTCLRFECMAGACNCSCPFASMIQQAVRLLTPPSGPRPGIKIISKIESWHGITNYDEILAASDGIMIARGDLAMEVSNPAAMAQLARPAALIAAECGPQAGG